MKLLKKQNQCPGANSRWSLRSLFTRKRATDPTPATASHEPALPPGTKRILVVDNDEFIRTTTALKLRSQGYAVTTVADGPAAIHAARSEHPDLILLDLSFPADVSLS